MRNRKSVVWHLSFPLMNSSNKTEVAFSPIDYDSLGLSLFIRMIAMTFIYNYSKVAVMIMHINMCAYVCKLALCQTS